MMTEMTLVFINKLVSNRKDADMIGVGVGATDSGLYTST
jgi:hypothetical protein